MRKGIRPWAVWLLTSEPVGAILSCEVLSGEQPYRTDHIITQGCAFVEVGGGLSCCRIGGSEMLLDCSFWRDFLANFLSDILAGGIIGTALGLWAARRLSVFERSLQRRDEKIAELQKAKCYLELLKGEIDGLLEHLPAGIELFESSQGISQVGLATQLWDMLQPSGELPRLPITPDLIEKLALFYHRLARVREAQNWIKSSWLIQEPDKVPAMRKKVEDFNNSVLSELRKALALGKEDLQDKLDLEISALREQLEDLQGE
jgi:gas vesicle protein